MKTKNWREIRARKFPPEKLGEIDQAVAEELWIAEAQRRTDELATGKVKGVPVAKALKRDRGQVT